MSDKTFRPITDLEIVEQMSDNDTVLIERNGMLKRTKGVGNGLPKGEAPNQQLVTDADGNAVWEDKLCYEYVGEIDVIPETTFVISENGTFLDNPNHATFEDGKAYIVTFDDAVYEVVASEVEENMYGIMFNVGSDSVGAVFLPNIEGVPAEMVGKLLIFFNGDIDGEHTIRISTIGETAKKIDSKYLTQPDMEENDPDAPGYIKNRIAHSHMGHVEVFHGEVSTNNYNGGMYRTDELPIALKFNAQYHITIDHNGESKSLTSVVTEVDGKKRLDINSDEPPIAYIEVDPYYENISRFYGFTDASNPPIVTINEVAEIVKTVDPKYLPDMCGKDSGRTVIFDGVMEASTYDGWYYGYNDPVAIEVGKVYEITLNFSRHGISKYVRTAVGDYNTPELHILHNSLHGGTVFVIKGGADKDSYIRGDWAGTLNVTIAEIHEGYIGTPEHLQKLPPATSGSLGAVCVSEIKDADDNYSIRKSAAIPVWMYGENMKLYADNPLPEVTKSNDKGKVLLVNNEGEWAAETLLPNISSSDSGKVPKAQSDGTWRLEDALIVKSSTSGSTKKFKLTVDDSGTITAQEVT